MILSDHDKVIVNEDLILSSSIHGWSHTVIHILLKVTKTHMFGSTVDFQ